MVDVAQLVEPRIVIPVVVGSSPIAHPIFSTFLFDLAKEKVRSSKKSRAGKRRSDCLLSFDVKF